MKHPGRLLLWALFLCTLTAHGRIGETMDECIERYGAARAHRTVSFGGVNLPWVRFEKGGLTIEVTFHEGSAQRIVYRATYQRDERDEHGLDLTRGVALLLLDKNSTRNGEWRQILANADTGDGTGPVNAWFFQRCGRYGSRVADYHYTPRAPGSFGHLDIRTSSYIRFAKRVPEGL